MNLSYPVPYSAVIRSLGPAVNLAMVGGGGERAHYQRRWNCGCVVLELDDRCRIEPCGLHRPLFEGYGSARGLMRSHRIKRSLLALGAVGAAFVLLGGRPAPSAPASIPATSPAGASSVAQSELAAFAAARSRMSRTPQR